jgi:hypothetical protein
LSTLTTMMRRAGLLTEEEAERVRAHCEARRIAPFVGLIELGLADEYQLCEFMHSKLMIPVAREGVLEHIDPETLRHVPAELAWAHAVLPVSIDDVGNLTLAMADPTDVRGVDAVAAHTGMYVVRAVAPVAALRGAIMRYYGDRPPELRGPPTPLQVPAVGGVPESVIAAESSGIVAPLSPRAFARLLPRLIAADDRDEIMTVLLDFLSEGFERVILFIHLRNQLKGRDARGSDLLIDAITQVRIPTTGPSVFADVIGRGETYFGPWPTERTIDRAFADAMGGIEGSVLVLPVRVRDKVPVLVFASGTTRGIDQTSLVQLTAGVQDALERLIFRRKAGGGV